MCWEKECTGLLEQLDMLASLITHMTAVINVKDDDSSNITNNMLEICQV